MSEVPRTLTLDDRLRQRDRPAGRPAMYQTWSDLLFLHWRVEPERIQRTLPPGLFVDTYDGAAWVGVVPFSMRNIRPWWFPCVPWVSNFLELNVRTYVHDAAGTPGVWFYSLDCNQPLAVWSARTFFHLPYRHAAMQADRDGRGTILYSSNLLPITDRKSHTFSLDYRLSDDRPAAEPGSLEFFLVERYVLFAAARGGGLRVGRVHHAPYPLCRADVGVQTGQLLGELMADHDFGVYRRLPDHLIASPGVDVDVFALERCRGVT